MFVCCSVAAQGIGAIGQAFGFACTSCTECLCPSDRPNPFFVLFTLIINGVGIALSLSGLTKTKDCDKMLIWFIIYIVLAALNILFSFYLYKRFTTMIQNGKAVSGTVNFFLYDVGVYFYLWVAGGCIVWIILGGIWKNKESSDCKAVDSVLAPLILFIVYLALGAFMICCTMCTDCLRTPKWKQPGAALQQPLAPPLQPVHGYAQPPPGNPGFKQTL
eukprot:NODE_6791_length_842_cov_44.317107_g6193_i0.p1 GENE.NODE_6791_length_842_cov_44.317107_g6193_i0~~NODE_6791_length_842_cov_44.317107_g6193_i0.p1  ORF type:complete len:218 (-),score=15.83 NODE_6791_length_842_cov_44.317107_g6193_i0:130-783(-)